MCFRTLEWKKSNCEAMEEGDSQVSVLEFYAACLVSATLAKYESLLVPSENRALVYFSHVVFCICQILPIFHSLQSYFGWQSVKIEVEKKHDHFLSDAPCKSIVGCMYFKYFCVSKRSLSYFCHFWIWDLVGRVMWTTLGHFCLAWDTRVNL